jgi:hypothetical protein
MRFAGWPWLLVSALALAPGCRHGPKRLARLRTQRIGVAPQQLVPLKAEKAIDQLTLPSFEPATVFVPVGARWARPVIVAIHGTQDTPEANCNAWSVITERDTFVLCPSLRPLRAGGAAPEECSTIDCLADELREALVALRNRYGRYVARHEVALAGFGAGAGRVVPIALQNPSVFSVLWLVNGGVREWSSALSTNYAQRGGRLLGLVCSDTSCEADAFRAVASARAAGLKTALAKPGQLGVSWDAPVVESARQVWKSTKPEVWPWSFPRKSEHKSSLL